MLRVLIVTAILAAFLFLGRDVAANEAVEKQVEELVENIKQDNEYKEKAEAIAEKANEYFNSQEFQERLDAQVKKLEETVFKGARPQDEKTADGLTLNASSGETIYLFISSSIPKSTLRNYFADMAATRSPNVHALMRGLIGGMKKIGPTLEFVTSVSVKEPDCDIKSGECEMNRVNVQINPQLFKQYNVTRMPAIVYVPASDKDFLAVYGDVPFSFALEKINARVKSEWISNLLTRMKGGFFEKSTKRD